MEKIKIVFLGTNGWYDTDCGNTICILIKTANEYIILDAGTGIYKVDKYIKDNRPIYLFISHFHLDHVIGLHILAKFKFKQGLNFCIQKGQTNNLLTLMSRQFTMPFKDVPFPTKIIEIGKKTAKIPFLENALQLLHPVPCMGFRLNLSGKILTYIPDTGLCENAYKLAKNADLLISDCAFKAGQNSDLWPHLNPQTAAKLALGSNAKRLALTHFDAEVYQTLKERKVSENKANKIFPNSFASYDGMEVTI